MLGTLKKLIATSAVALALAAVTASPAPAYVNNARAALSCQAGIVRAYPPHHNYTTSTYTWDNLKTRANLWRWNGTTKKWNYVTTSGWWANGATDASHHVASALGQYWVTNGGMGALFRRFNVARGHYYAVTTDVWDSRDGRVTTVTNHLDASNLNSRYYCAA